jgi:L-fuculose-phosphate aldolase
MANHGSVATGSTLDKALDNALLLEWLCRVYLDAHRLGAPRRLTPDEQAAVVDAAVNRRYGQVKPVSGRHAAPDPDDGPDPDE